MRTDPDVPQRHYTRFDPDLLDQELERAVWAWVADVLRPPSGDPATLAADPGRLLDPAGGSEDEALLGIYDPNSTLTTARATE